MQQQLAAIDGHLSFTSEHAETAKHQLMTARRATLASTYSVALAKIDPDDPAKGKGSTQQVIAAAQAVTGQVAQFRSEVEKAFNEWLTRKPKKDAAAQQVNEMRTWGHEKAPTMQGPLDGVTTFVDAHAYAAACAAFDTLLSELKPAFEDYQTQKAAKDKYDPAKLALEPKFSDMSKSTYKKLETSGADIASEKAVMERAAQAKDYARALQIVTGLTTKVDAYLKDVKDLDDRKTAYQKVIEPLKPKLDQAAQNSSVKLAPLREELSAIKTQMETGVEGEDFAQAAKYAGDLASKVDVFLADVKDLEAKKKAYQDTSDTLKKKLTECQSSRFAKLAPDQQEITTLQGNMEAAEKAEDFDKALALATQLTSDVDAYLDKAKGLEEKKKQYEQARDALKERLVEISGGSHPKLAAMQQDINSQQGLRDSAERDEDFEKALGISGDLKSKVDAYDASVGDLTQKKKDFESARDALKPQLDEINKSTTKALAPMQEAIVGAQKAIDETAKKEEYEQALTLVQSLTKMLDDYKKTEAGQIYVINYDNKDYRGTAEELAALKLKIAQIAIQKALPLLHNRAQANQGWYNELQKVNDQGIYYIIGAVVRFAGSANLNSVLPLLQKQQPAIAAAEQAINADLEHAEAKFEAADEAIRATGKSIGDYLDALDSGAGKTISVLDAIKVVCFAIGVAAGGAVLIEAGVATATAAAASSAGFAVLESLAQDIGKNAIMDQKSISAGEIVGNAVIKGIASGATAYVGAVATAQVSSVVVGRLMSKFAATDSASQLIIKHVVETGLASTVQTLVGKSPELVRGQLTFEQFCEEVFKAFVVGLIAGGVVGYVRGNELRSKNLKQEEVDAALAKLEGATTGRKPPSDGNGSGDHESHASDPGQYAKLKAELAAKHLQDADRRGTGKDGVIRNPSQKGSGLRADSDHRMASFLTEAQVAKATVTKVKSGTLVQVPDQNFNGKVGIVEYIIDTDGTVTHQRFIEGGVIGSGPNQKADGRM
jgi:hypothetical protein